MLKNETVFDNETRRYIYNYISFNPGVHFRDISRKLNLSVYNLKHHIRILIKNSYIIEKRENGYLRFFIANKISNLDKKIIYHLRQKTTRNIILALLYNVVVSQKELCEYLEKAPSTVNFHIDKLLKDDVIEMAIHKKGLISRLIKPKTMKKEVDRREILFRLKEPQVTYLLIIKNKETILDDETWLILDSINLFVKIGTPKLKFGYFGKDHMVNSINICWEIFPHPYHV